MPDLTQYQPPGVYVEDLTVDVVTPLAQGLPGGLLTIVGAALGYQSTTESVRLYSGAFASLLNNNVLQDSSLVLRTQSGVLLTAGADYAITVDNTGPEPVTQIKRLPTNAATASPAGVVEGDLVKVTYRYTSSSYYTPQVFTNYSDVANFYGPAFVNVVGAADPIASQLSMAAKVAFENGASQLMLLAVKHGTIWRDDFNTAYAMLATDHRVSVMVSVLPDSEVSTGAGLTNVLTDLRVHCDNAASNGYGRLILTGASAAFDDSATPFETIAQAVNNKRIVLVYPSRFNLFNPDINQSVEVDGSYAAVALGARLILNDVQRSLTRQPVNSFSSIPPSVNQKMSLAFKNNLSSKGVCVIETDRTGRLVVRHGVTTAPAALTTREISLVRVADTLFQNVQVGMDNAGHVGQPITPDLTIAVKGTLQGILEAQIRSKVIVSYTQVLVRQQALPNGDPSVIECQFSYKAAVPLNYITVKFSINLTTGDVNATNAL